MIVTNCFRADGHDKGSAHDITIQIPALYLETAGIYSYFHPGSRSIGKNLFCYSSLFFFCKYISLSVEDKANGLFLLCIRKIQKISIISRARTLLK